MCGKMDLFLDVLLGVTCIVTLTTLMVGIFYFLVTDFYG